MRFWGKEEKVSTDKKSVVLISDDTALYDNVAAALGEGWQVLWYSTIFRGQEFFEKSVADAALVLWDARRGAVNCSSLGEAGAFLYGLGARAVVLSDSEPEVEFSAGAEFPHLLPRTAPVAQMKSFLAEVLAAVREAAAKKGG